MLSLVSTLSAWSKHRQQDAQTTRTKNNLLAACRQLVELQFVWRFKVSSEDVSNTGNEVRGGRWTMILGIGTCCTFASQQACCVCGTHLWPIVHQFFAIQTPVHITADTVLWKPWTYVQVFQHHKPTVMLMTQARNRLARLSQFLVQVFSCT